MLYLNSNSEIDWAVKLLFEYHNYNENLLKKGMITFDVALNTVREQSLFLSFLLHLESNVVRGHECCPLVILYPMTMPFVLQFLFHI